MADIVEILIVAKNLTGPGFADAHRGMSALDNSVKKFHQTAAIAGTAMGLLLVESVKMASKFDSEMTLLETQAGVAHGSIKQLSSGVLKLSGEVAQNPDSLAESLFHVESNFQKSGISGKKALDLVKVAAKGATLGHADLVDVTNALTAAIAANIPGAENMSQAMGVLNGIVGIGDMKMQDLAESFGTGAIAAVAGFGLSLKDAGATLAVFGDNNIRGANAGTQLRMSVMGLANPVAQGADALKRMGLESDTLAKDMQKGGLKLALNDLVKHMTDAGISADQQGQIITDAFGKKAGIGLNILVREVGRFNDSFRELDKMSKTFGKSWEETTKTFAFQTKQLKYSVESLMIAIGEKLIPVVRIFVGLMLQHKTVTLAVVAALATLLTSIALVSLGMKTVAAATYLFRDSLIAAELGLEVSRIRWGFMTVQIVAMYTAQYIGIAATKTWSAVQIASSAVSGAVVTAYNAITTSLMFMRAAYVNGGRGFSGMMAALSQLGPVQAVKNAFVGMRLAAVQAGGGIAGIQAAFASLSTGAKLGGAIVVIAGIVLALKSIADLGKQAPADIDALTTSLTNLGRTGKVSGEALRVYGSDLSGLVDSLKFDPSAMNSFQQFFDTLGSGFGFFGDTLKETAESDIKPLDQALANLVNSGHADIAAAALKKVTEAGAKNGLSADKIKSQLTGYNNALAGTKTASDLVATSQGKFGKEAQIVQAQLAAQKAKADGLRESLQALDAVNQAAYGSETAFYRAIAESNKSLKDKDKTLNVHTEAGRKHRDILQAMAAATDDLTSKMADQGDSFKSINKKYEEGYNAIVKYAKGEGASTEAAKKLADHLLNIPADTSIKIKTNADKIQEKIDKLKAKMRSLPPSQQVYIKGQIKDLQEKLRQAKADLASVHGKTVTLYSKYVSVGKQPGTGTVLKATGGLLSGPGTGTSDDIPVMASNGEYILTAAAVKKYGPRFLDALNSGSVPAYASGGSVTKAEQSAKNSVSSQFDISFFGKIAGYKQNPFEKSMDAASSLGDLVSTLNKWRSTIKAALSGAAESGLLKHLTEYGKALISHEKALNKVNAELGKAKDKLSSLKDAAAQLKDSVSSGIISGANITGTAQSTGLTSTGRIMDQLTMDRDKAKALAQALAQLKSMGLNSQSLSEIGQAGVSGGGLATAQALLSASGGQIDQINSLEKQLKSSANSSGKTTADAVYAASIKHADKIVKALEKHQAALEKALKRLTDHLEKLIEKAFHIKHHAAGGAAGGTSWINEMGAELVHLPDGSTVYPAGQSKQMMAGHGGSSEPIVINLDLGGKHFEQIWVDTGRRAVRTRGGNVQVALGRPGS